MNVANLELCKELYELSGWSHFPDVNDLYYVVSNENELDNYVATWHELREAPETYWYTSYKTPAYDLGYLLRKLPASLPSKEYPFEYAKLWTRKDDHPEEEIESPTTYLAWYFVTGKVNGVADYGESADTPEDAVALLCIELFKQGVLNKKEDSDE